MNWRVDRLELETRHPFLIARGGAQRFTNLRLRLDCGDLHGEGEGSPTHYYGETPATSQLALEHILTSLGDRLRALDPSALCPESIASILAAADRLLAGNPAAKAALDGALWDLLGKARGEPVWRLLGLDAGGGAGIQSSFTIALVDPATTLERAREALAAGYGILKVKAGDAGDIERVELLAAETEARIRVDVNGAWSAAEALPKIERLALAGVEFVEQPLEMDDLAGYRAIAGRAPLPIVLDESVHDALGLAVFGELADAVNLKISKLGGITRCLELARSAREAGLDLMMGCMIESSLGIAQGLQLAPLLRWADLDGALLLSSDPYAGLETERGRFSLTTAPGLGVAARRDS